MWGKISLITGIATLVIAGVIQTIPFRPPSVFQLELILNKVEPAISIENRFQEAPVIINGEIRGREEFHLLGESLRGASGALKRFNLPLWQNEDEINSARIYLLKTRMDAYFEQYPREAHLYGFQYDNEILDFYDYLRPEINTFLDQRVKELGVRERYAMFRWSTAHMLEKIHKVVEEVAKEIQEIPERGAIAQGQWGRKRALDYVWSYRMIDEVLNMYSIPTEIVNELIDTFNKLKLNEVRNLTEVIENLWIERGSLTMESRDVRVIFHKTGYQILIGPYEDNFEN